MEPNLLQGLGQVAGIGGIALGVFLIIFRDVIRKKIFPRLSQRQAYQIILVALVLAWTVAIAGIGAWWLSKTRLSEPNSQSPSTVTNQVLALSLWTVELDAKGALINTREFPMAAGSNIAPALAHGADWIADELELPPKNQIERVRLDVSIPADLTNTTPRIKRVPGGPMEILLWDLRGRGKARVPLDWESAQEMRVPYQLEVRVPGRKTELLEVTPGVALEKQIPLEPEAASVGLERFSNDLEGLAESLGQQLIERYPIRVVDPARLERIREELDKQFEAIRENPGVQISIRSSGLDYIVTGNLRAERAGEVDPR